MRAPTLLSLLLTSTCNSVLAAGLIEDSTLDVLSRNFYLDNKERSPSSKPHKEEWAQGFIANFASGFTPGTIGIGVDAHAFIGLKLDGGKGHSGTGLLPVDSDGRSERDYSSAGGALKLRASKTTLSVGEMTVETPVFDTSDKRLQPEYATGLLLDSREFDALHWQAGHFTAFKNQDASSAHGDFSGYGASTRSGAIDFIGGQFFEGQPLGGALYTSQLSDTWRQYYANLHWSPANWMLDSNIYRTQDQGRAEAGAIANTAYSLAGKYSFAAQSLTLAYQKINGDTPFDFVGGDSIYLANSIKYADFNGPGESSWQLRYDLNLATFGIPGLKFMTRYVTGRGIDGTHAPQDGAYTLAQGHGGRHWERDIDLHYVVQSGPAKDLSVQLSHVSHRANTAQAGDDIDRVYVVIEYPLTLR